MGVNVLEIKNRIDMVTDVQRCFPDIYTKRGSIKKEEPKRYVCLCGNMFSKTEVVGNFEGIKFERATCGKCGSRGERNKENSVWERMITGQVEQEDFILNVLQEKGIILKEDLEKKIEKEFSEETRALGFLVYFGYLKVDTEERDINGIIKYQLNNDKNLNQRYERAI